MNDVEIILKQNKAAFFSMKDLFLPLWFGLLAWPLVGMGRAGFLILSLTAGTIAYRGILALFSRESLRVLARSTGSFCANLGEKVHHPGFRKALFW